MKEDGLRRKSVTVTESKCNGNSTKETQKSNCDNGYEKNKERKKSNNTIVMANGTSSSILVTNSIVEADEEEEKLAG